MPIGYGVTQYFRVSHLRRSDRRLVGLLVEVDGEARLRLLVERRPLREVVRYSDGVQVLVHDARPMHRRVHEGPSRLLSVLGLDKEGRITPRGFETLDWPGPKRTVVLPNARHLGRAFALSVLGPLFVGHRIPFCVARSLANFRIMRIHGLLRDQRLAISLSLILVEVHRALVLRLCLQVLLRADGTMIALRVFLGSREVLLKSGVRSLRVRATFLAAYAL